MASISKTARASWAERVRTDFEAGGLVHVIRHICHKLGSPALEWGRLAFYARDLDGGLPQPAASRAVELRQATEADLPRLVFDGKPTSAAALAERFRQGHLCFVAIDAGGRVTHARWVSTDRAHVPELDADVVMPPGEAYMYDGYTRPEARGTGIDGVMRCFIFRSLKDAGLRRAHSYVRGDNPVGVRAAQRWQRLTGTVPYLRLTGFRPLVGAGRGQYPQLVGKRALETRERDERAQALRAWFRSWIGGPLHNRSTGYTAPPEAYFKATAQYVVETLKLDADSDVVLDVGCDSAMVSRHVAPHCRKLVGVDFVPELLTDISRAQIVSPAAGNAAFAAADGRQLPFRSSTFSNVYCNGVVHALPSRPDGLAMIQDMVRVCAPGGRVLVGCIPDRRKRWHRRLDLWNESGLAPRLRLLASLVVPPPMKRALRRRGLLPGQDGPTFLEYDLAELRRSLASDGVRVEILSFPECFWSRDYRRTRSNLLITKLPVSSGRL